MQDRKSPVGTTGRPPPYPRPLFFIIKDNKNNKK